MIPLIVHQTWRTNKLPNVFQNIYDKNKELNHEFEFKIWNHENEHSDMDQLIKTEFSDIYHIYNRCKFGVQKADIARLAILYKYGGVYFDLDILCLKPLKDLLDFNSNFAYFALEPKEQTMKILNNDNVLCNAFIASAPNNPLFKLALDSIKSHFIKNGDAILNVFNFFGADLVTNIIAKNNIKCNFINRKLIYPINDPKFNDLSCSKNDWQMLKRGDYNDSFTVHYWIHSDFESKKLIENFVFDDTKNIHDNMFDFFKDLYPNNVFLSE